MKNYIILSALLLACSSASASAEVKHGAHNYSKSNINSSKTSNTSSDSLTADYSESQEVYDPAEPVNRAIYKFNAVVDGYVIRPVAVSYRYVVPQWGRQRVTNFFYNLSEPVTFVNSALQADPQNTFTALWRFLINSTFGILGTFDAASDLGLKPRQEDFGQTMGTWGYNESAFVELPLLGPSNVRDSVGLVVDYFTNPFYDGLVIHSEWTRLGLGVADALDKRTNLLDITDDIDKNSLDPYAAYRSAYTQKRNSDIANGKNATTY